MGYMSSNSSYKIDSPFSINYDITISTTVEHLDIENRIAKIILEVDYENLDLYPDSSGSSRAYIDVLDIVYSTNFSNNIYNWTSLDKLEGQKVIDEINGRITMRRFINLPIAFNENGIYIKENIALASYIYRSDTEQYLYINIKEWKYQDSNSRIMLYQSKPIINDLSAISTDTDENYYDSEYEITVGIDFEDDGLAPFNSYKKMDFSITGIYDDPNLDPENMISKTISSYDFIEGANTAIIHRFIFDTKKYYNELKFATGVEIDISLTTQNTNMSATKSISIDFVKKPFETFIPVKDSNGNLVMTKSIPYTLDTTTNTLKRIKNISKS